MSFLGVLKQDATEVETAVVGGLKTALDYVDNFAVTELVPDLEAALLAGIEKLGQEVLAGLLGTAVAAAPTPSPASAPPAAS